MASPAKSSKQFITLRDMFPNIEDDTIAQVLKAHKGNMINSTTELLEINRQLELFKQKEVEEQKKEEARQKDEKKRAEDERRQRETQERAKREEAKAQAKQAYQQELQQQAQEVQQQLLQAHQQALHAQQQAGQLPEHLSKLMKAQKEHEAKLEARRAAREESINKLTQSQNLSASLVSSHLGVPTTADTIASLRSELSKVEENEASLKASILQQQKSEIQALKEKIKEQEAMINQINEELKQSQSDNALAASRVLDDIKKNGTGLTSISNNAIIPDLLASITMELSTAFLQESISFSRSRMDSSQYHAHPYQPLYPNYHCAYPPHPTPYGNNPLPWEQRSVGRPPYVQPSAPSVFGSSQ